jgi:hypothetical protein
MPSVSTKGRTLDHGDGTYTVIPPPIASSSFDGYEHRAALYRRGHGLLLTFYRLTISKETEWPDIESVANELRAEYRKHQDSTLKTPESDPMNSE